MEEIKKSKAINILVPKLIDKTENLKKEIKSRILMNKIFSEFENKASDKLNYFITNSFKRCNCAKYGNNLDTFLSETQRENKNEINKILNNDFYKDEEYTIEKKKMKYRSTNKLLKDINRIFDNLKYPLETRFGENSKIKIQEIVDGIDESKPKIKNKIKKIEYKKIIPTKRNFVRFYSKESLTNDKKIIISEIDKEQKSIKDSIDDYLNKINSKIIKGDIKNGISPTVLLNSESYNKRPKINFPRIKFLNYSKIKAPKEPKIIKRDIQKSPDVKKVLSLYKIFKKREKNERNNSEYKKIPFITEIGIKVNKDKEYEYDNTQDIVYTTANNELKLQKKFENKRKRFEDLFGLNNIPNITTYNNIIDEKIGNFKNRRIKKIKITKNIKNLFSVKDKYDEIIDEEMKKLDAFEERLLSKSKKYK